MSATTSKRELVYYVATTVDHYIAHKDGSIDGFLPDGPAIPVFLESLHGFGAILMGRHTYEFGYQYGMQPGDPAYPHTGLMNYVFSSSMAHYANEHLKVIADDAAAFVRQLKAEPGKPLWLCGGGQLAGTLLDCGLIDRLILKVNPVVFGDGIPLFGGSRKRVDLALQEARVFNNGVTFMNYDVRYVQLT